MRIRETSTCLVTPKRQRDSWHRQVPPNMRTFPSQRTGKNFHHGTERIQSEVNEEKGPGGNERTKASKSCFFLSICVAVAA
jgi:hypothetical protein